MLIFFKVFCIFIFLPMWYDWLKSYHLMMCLKKCCGISWPIMQQSSSVSIFSYDISEVFQYLPLEQACSCKLNTVFGLHFRHPQCFVWINQSAYMACLVTAMLLSFIGVVGAKLLGSSLQIQTSHWNTMWNLDGVVKVLYKCIGYFCVDVLIFV